MGVYDLAAPLCGSTSESPLYPAAGYRVALFDFDDLVEHTLTVEAQSVSERFQSNACAVTTTRTIFRNYDGIFSTRHDRRFVFEPLGCTLSATAQATTYRIGPEFSDLLKDSTDSAEELPFEVTSDIDHIYMMTSQDLDDLNNLWASYGCAKPDRLKMQATLRL